jgi:hypothetical protein
MGVAGEREGKEPHVLSPWLGDALLAASKAGPFVLHYAVALSDQPHLSFPAEMHPPPAEGLLVQPLQGAATPLSHSIVALFLPAVADASAVARAPVLV